MVNNEVKVKDRIRLFMERTGIGRNQLALEIGCATSSVCNFLENGKTMGKMVYNMLNTFPDLSAEWLIRGNGEMLLSDAPVAHNKVSYLAEPTIEHTAIIPDASMTDKLQQLQEENERLKKEVIALNRSNAILEYRIETELKQ